MIRVVGIDADLITYSAGFVLAKREKEGKKVTINDAHTITDTIVRKILRESKATHYLGFLTYSPANFRIAVAKTLKYKGNRDKAKEKNPIPFKQEIINHMIIAWGFQLIKGMEADDALTIAGEYFRHKVETYVLATKDKDLWQWEGEHFNMNTNELMFIDATSAHYNLWKQVITGDMPTDNIPGLSHAGKYQTPGFSDVKVRPLPEHTYGPKSVEKLLAGVDPKEYARVILEEYLWCYGAWGDEDDDDFAEERFYETFALVYMLLELPEGTSIHYDYTKCTKKDLEVPMGFEGYTKTKSEF